MSVIAKFFVAEVTLTSAGQNQGSVVLRPVSRGAINSRWAAATPSGELRMHVSNPAGFLWFKDRIGKECRLTIEEYEARPSDGHPFVERPDVEAARAGNVYGAEHCLECGYPADDHSSGGV